MPTFFEFFIILEDAAGSPRNHDELLAAHPDEESQLLIKHGIHPLTMEPLPVHLRPGYSLHPSDPDALPLAPDPHVPAALPTPYKLMQDNPLAGQKDKWGRPIYNPDQHPEYLRQQDAIMKKMRKRGLKGMAYSEPGEGKTHDRFGRKQVYDVQPPQ